MLVVRECSDERDRVYAALGLAKTDSSTVSDNNMSFAKIGLDLTRKNRLAGDFSVLHDVEPPVSNTSCRLEPSFVPSLRPDIGQDRPIPLDGYDTSRYCAGFKRSFHTRPRGPNSIIVCGVNVQQVDNTDDFAGAVSDLIIGRGCPYKPGLLEAYDRMTTAYRPATADSGESQTPEEHFKLAVWRAINLGFHPKRANLPYYEKSIDLQFLDLVYRQNIVQSFTNRVFFMVRQAFLGLGPKWMKARDRMVIFDGAETPFVFRQKFGKDGKINGRRFIGDSYLQGWMNADYFAHGIVDVKKAAQYAMETCMVARMQNRSFEAKCLCSIERSHDSLPTIIITLRNSRLGTCHMET
jgi:hypothetical protein